MLIMSFLSVCVCVRVATGPMDLLSVSLSLIHTGWWRGAKANMAASNL